MRDLHEQLRTLVAQHGVAITESADQFRAALDDYLTEQDASQGELNLLVDAVRLGGVDRLVTMLDNGADPQAAVREAGGELARDRSSDEQRARWAVAAVAYALGRVGGDVVRRQIDGDATRIAPGHTAPAGTPPTPPTQQPVQSPPYQPPVASPPHQPPAWPTPQQPQHQQAFPQQHVPAYAAPPRKSRTGLWAGLAGLVALVVVGVVVIVVLASGDDGDNEADKGGGGNGGETPTACDPCVEGNGYQYQLPDGWSEVTDTLPDDSSGAVLDTAVALGKSIETGRANVIVEISDWVYSDLDEAKERFTSNLQLSLNDPTSEEIDGRTFDGEEAVGIRITSTNEADLEVEQTAYLMRRDDDAIVIYASNEAGDEGPKDAYQKIYESWQWQD